MTNAPNRDELPLPDYDHIPNGTLPTRITGLDESQVEQLLAYERAHPPSLQGFVHWLRRGGAQVKRIGQAARAAIASLSAV